LDGLDRGFRGENVLVVKAPDVIDDPDRYAQALEAYKRAAAAFSEITSVSITSDVPGSPVGWYNGARRLSAETTYPPAIVYTMTVDDHFVSTYQIRMKAGRFFSDVSANNNRTVVLNEEGIKSLGFASAEEALQGQIRLRGDTLQIVGVMENYFHESPKVPMKPTVYLRIPEEKLYFSIRSNAAMSPTLLANLHSAYASVFPEAVFEHTQLSDNYAKQYQDEFAQLSTFRIFGLVAIVLACMGLFALTSYTVVQRIKEIGVRKILGSSDFHIFALFTGETIRLVVVSIGLAIPAGFYLMHRWLEQFVNRTSIDPGIVLGTSAIALSITLAAVVYNALRAARMNAVRSLRTE